MMRSRFDALLRLSWSGRLRLLEATIALTAVSGGIRTTGYGRTRTVLIKFCPDAGARPVTERLLDLTVAELAWSVSAAAQHAPFPTTCLHRALTLWWLLRRRGIESDVRIGTARTQDTLHAHAWLERDGVVLNDDADVGERFSAFEQFR